jgi:hypothetical protein
LNEENADEENEMKIWNFSEDDAAFLASPVNWKHFHATGDRNVEGSLEPPRECRRTSNAEYRTV